MAVSIAVVLHELSHMLLCKLLRIPILGLKALPWGLTVSAPIMYEPSSQLAVSLAGPMCNLFLLMLCPALRTFAGKEISDVFAIANLANSSLLYRLTEALHSNPTFAVGLASEGAFPLCL